MASAGGGAMSQPPIARPHPPPRPRGDPPGRSPRRPPLIADPSSLRSAVVFGAIVGRGVEDGSSRSHSPAGRVKAPSELERAPSRIDSAGDAVINPYITLPSIGSTQMSEEDVMVPQMPARVRLRGMRPTGGTVNVLDANVIPSAQRVAAVAIESEAVPKPPTEKRIEGPNGSRVRRAVAGRHTNPSDAAREPLPDEPAAGDADAVSIAVRLQDGRRLQRRFRKSDKVSDVVRFVQEQGIPRLTLVGNGAPAVRYTATSQTLEAAGIDQRALLLAEEPKKR